ncbi:MAG TPA: pyridoxine 5'-phosphate synthase [Nitrospirota bacterium]|nr:pyridoxine 5'-phosphate synthase [Nitrospirota bacterium]
MAKLGVNIDHVATVRQARMGAEPDPAHAAVLAELAGADGITVHLREDRRHIQDRDLRVLRETVKVPLNLEMAVSEEIIRIALEVRPEMVTLVPEKREELTTEGGLDVKKNRDKVAEAVRTLRDGGIFVSLFIDPDLDQVKESKKTGADAVEIHTGPYADATTYEASHKEYEKIYESCKLAYKLGLTVNAGHGLNYHNVRQIAKIKEIYEMNIGHSIISRAVLVGLERAVKEMKALIG